MNTWDQQVASVHTDYIDALEQRGFARTSPNTLDGTVDSSDGRKKITVVLHRGFPFLPPYVHVRELDLPRSWHVDPDDYLCLYTADDYNSAPWHDPDAFLARVAEWFDQAAAGWPGDTPVLDAERYLHSDDAKLLVIYDDLRPFLGRYARLRQDARGFISLETTGPPPSSRRGDRRRYARVADVGELAYPPKDWNDIRQLLPNPDEVEQEIRDRKIQALILVYQRHRHPGVIAVHTFPLTGGGIGTTAYRSASAEHDVTTYRSGRYRDLLAGKNVLIVGAGAIGSFLADMLTRNGVGRLTLRDGDILKPGNVVRHLCGPDRIGMNKAVAVRDDLAHRTTVITVDTTMLFDPADATALFAEHDLVIDASANGAVTAMLGRAADTLGTTLLSVWVPVTRSSLCGLHVLVKETAEPVAAGDPDVSARARVGKRPQRPGLAEGAVRTVLVEVLLVFGQHTDGVMLVKDEDPVQRLAPQAAHEPFGDGVRPRRSDRRRQDLHAGGGDDSVEDPTELAVVIPDEEPERPAGIIEVRHQVAGQLCQPLAGRMCGYPKDPDPAGAVLDNEEAVQAGKRHGLHVEQVAGEDRVRLRLQELCLGRPGPSRRRVQAS